MAIKKAALNGAIRAVLHGMSRSWRVDAEETRRLREGAALTPDIVVNIDGHLPIIIENAIAPGHDAKTDAVPRLGKHFDTGRTVGKCVEMVSPGSFRECGNAEEAAVKIRQGARFEYALHSMTGRRFPRRGRLDGTIRDLASFLMHVGVEEHSLRRSIDILTDGVESGIALVKPIFEKNKETRTAYARLLRHSFDDRKPDQVLGVAISVMANAFVHQQRLSDFHSIPSIGEMRERDELTKSGVMAAWRGILEINYWPVFHLARELLHEIRSFSAVGQMIRVLAKTAERIAEEGASQSHDLTGVVLQRFITERKHLASFYTRPESAVLLARMAIPDSRQWDDVETYRGFRVADYACGTGTLIHAAYDRMRRLHEMGGGDGSASHAHMMAEALTAADIVPSAAHMTASMLSGVFPNVPYGDTRIVIPSYGWDASAKDVRLGSLELLSKDSALASMLWDLDATTRIGMEGETATHAAKEMSPGSQDLVMMNPPFTRGMSGWEPSAEGTYKTYNAFGNSREDQQAMKKREEMLGKGTCRNGHQSLPSSFCAVADRMLRQGGTVALVLPITAVQGVSWRKFRGMLAEKYADVVVVSLSGVTSLDCSWSADTKLAEVLIVARKMKEGERRKGEARGMMVTLFQRPRDGMEASELARAMARMTDNGRIWRKEDGPYGGAALTLGSGGEICGRIVSGRIGEGPWSALMVRDPAVVQVVEHLKGGRLWLPGRKRPEGTAIPIRALGEVVRVGHAGNNIAQNRKSAFVLEPWEEAATFPALARIDSRRQRSMLLQPDAKGVARPGRTEHAHRVWEMRSRAHMATSARFTAQRVVAAFTSQRTLGVDWTTLQGESELQEKMIVLWGNSTLGVMQYWEHSSRQQIGRGRMPVTQMATMPFLDVTRLSAERLAAGSRIFDELKGSGFRRIRLGAEDRIRKRLDAALLTDVLGFDDDVVAGMDLLRRKFCAEPGVHGGAGGTGEGEGLA